MQVQPFGHAAAVWVDIFATMLFSLITKLFNNRLGKNLLPEICDTAGPAK